MPRRLRDLLTLLLLVASTAFAAAAPLALGVLSAHVSRDMATGEPVLDLTLDPESTKAFAAFTAANVGKDVAILIGGEEAMRARLVAPIAGGVIRVSGSFAGAALQGVADLIATGALAVEVDVVGE